MVKYVLTPFGQGADYLNRIEIDTEDENVELVLGRNPFTGLSDSTRPNFQYVSRRHVLITVQNGVVYMQSVSTQPDAVYYNGFPCAQTGPRELREGDCLSLLGVKAYYNYFLSRVQCNTISRQASATSSSAALNATLTLSEPQLSGNRTQSLGNSSTNGINSNGSSTNGANGGNNVGPMPRADLNKSDDVVILASTIEPHVVPQADAVEVVEVVDLLSPSASGSSSSSAHTVAASTSSAGSTADAALPTAVPKLAPSRSSEDITRDIANRILREYECSICYETIACASSVHPCGCSFCLVCIADWAGQSKTGASANAECSCPNCQGKFAMTNVFPNRLVDNALRAILQNIPQELVAWEERLQQGNERRRLITEAAAPTPASSAAAATAAPAEASTSAQRHVAMRAVLARTAEPAGNAVSQEQQARLNSRMEVLAARLRQNGRLPSPPRPFHNPAQAEVVGRSAAVFGVTRREPPQVIELLDSQPPQFEHAANYWAQRAGVGRAYPAPPQVRAPAPAPTTAAPVDARRPAPRTSINSFFTAAPTAAPTVTAAAPSVRSTTPPRTGNGLIFRVQNNPFVAPDHRSVNPSAASSRRSIVPGASLSRNVAEDRGHLREALVGDDSSSDELILRRHKKRKGPSESSSGAASNNNSSGNSSSIGNAAAPVTNQYVPAIPLATAPAAARTIPTGGPTGASTDNSFF